MNKSKDEIKKEFSDVKNLYKDGFKQIREEQKRKTEEKYNKEREEYARTKKVNYCSPTSWETMSPKKLKKINSLLTYLGIFFIAIGSLFLFATDDKLISIFIILVGLYCLFFDPRKFTSSDKKDKNIS